MRYSPILCKSAFFVFFVVVIASILDAAQAQVALNRELPEMLVRACPTLQDAHKEASLAYRLGQQPKPAANEIFKRNASCFSIFAVVTPIREETSILAFVTWGIYFNKESDKHISAPSFKTQVKVDFEPMMVRYYFANFVTEDGQRLSGWVEIPERPYIFQFLDHQKHRNP